LPSGDKVSLIFLSRNIVAGLITLAGAQCNRLIRHFHIYGFAAWEARCLALGDPVGNKADTMRETRAICRDWLAGRGTAENERTEPSDDA
jgi:hypothetical protein